MVDRTGPCFSIRRRPTTRRFLSLTLSLVAVLAFAGVTEAQIKPGRPGARATASVEGGNGVGARGQGSV
ncbi:MAG: hypothetical protein SFV24_20955, partial [Gemmatimonadales bacterium]|nr:hypothetical protein [Gemmatimonadales bacterium]